MTDREKAIVMAHTGICMLAGDKFQIFHQYVEDILGRPVQTIEMGIGSVCDEIKEKSRDDFIVLCREEQEQYGDCISRETVENAIKHAEVNFTVNSDIDFTKHKREVQEIVNGIIDAQIKALRDLPSVKPQPKMGRWVMSDDGLYKPICNKCGAHPWKGYIPSVEEAANVFKYCPNCGCRMEDVEE